MPAGKNNRRRGIGGGGDGSGGVGGGKEIQQAPNIELSDKGKIPT